MRSNVTTLLKIMISLPIPDPLVLQHFLFFFPQDIVSYNLPIFWFTINMYFKKHLPSPQCQLYKGRKLFSTVSQAPETVLGIVASVNNCCRNKEMGHIIISVVGQHLLSPERFQSQLQEQVIESKLLFLFCPKKSLCIQYFVYLHYLKQFDLLEHQI